MMEWVQANWDDLVGVALAVWTVVSMVVKLTPTQKDDDFLRKVMEYVSFLAPLGSGKLFSLPGTRVKR